MRLIRLFLNAWDERLFFSFKNLLCAFFIGTILISNFCLVRHLPKQIQLLDLENHAYPFSPVLFLFGNLALLALCGFSLSLKKPFDFLLLGLFSTLSVCLGVKSFFPSEMADLSFLNGHLNVFGYLLPKPFYTLSLFILGTVLIIAIFLPFTKAEPPPRKRFFALPFLMLFLTLIVAQSYRFRHVELNQFITEKTGLIASFAGKDSGLRFLYPRPHQDISQWLSHPHASLQTEEAGKRTALLVRREFSGIIGESLGFFLIQLSSRP